MSIAFPRGRAAPPGAPQVMFAQWQPGQCPVRSRGCCR